MTLKQMRYVIMVARFSSISEAAKKLYLTQPSLTNSIRMLEEELGFPIFLRGRNGVEVTPRGQEFLQQIKAVVERVDSIEERFSASGRERQELSISAQHYNFAADAFIRLVREAGPSYTFRFLETTTLQVIENTESGLSEVGILYYSKSNEAVILRELKNRHLSFQLLFRAGAHVFLRAGHPMADKADLTLDDLKPYPFLLYNQEPGSSSNFLEELVPAADRDQVMYIQDRSTFFRILEQTDAYSVGSGILSEDSSASLILSRPLNGCEEMYIGWIQKKGMALSPLARRFLSLIRTP